MEETKKIIKSDLISGLSFYERWTINNNDFFLFGENHNFGPDDGCQPCVCDPESNDKCCRTFFDYLKIFETLENYNLFIEAHYIYNPTELKKKLKVQKIQPSFVSFVSSASNIKIFQDRYFDCIYKLPNCNLNIKTHYTDLRFDLNLDQKFITLESKIFKIILDIIKDIETIYNQYQYKLNNSFQSFYLTLNKIGNDLVKEEFLQDFIKFLENPIEMLLLLSNKDFVNKKTNLKNYTKVKPLLYTQLSKGDLKIDNSTLEKIYNILLNDREKDLTFYYQNISNKNVNEVKPYLIDFVNICIKIAKHELLRDQEWIEDKRATINGEYEEDDEIKQFMKDVENFDNMDKSIKKEVTNLFNNLFPTDLNKLKMIKNMIKQGMTVLDKKYNTEEELDEIILKMIQDTPLKNKINFINQLANYLNTFYGSLLMDSYIIFRSFKYNENIAVLAGSAHTKYISSVLKYLTENKIIQGKIIEKSISENNYCDKVISLD
jgi:hypothetical protein